MTIINEKISLHNSENDYQSIIKCMEQALKDEKKRLVLYVEWKGLTHKQQCFLKDIKMKNVSHLEEEEKEEAKTILKMKKKFDYFYCKNRTERVNDEQKDPVVIKEPAVVKEIMVAKKKKKRKKPVRKLKTIENNYIYVICTDASTLDKEEKSVIAGVVSLRNGDVISTYTKNLKYTPNTHFLESLAILQMMKLAELENMEYVLFKTDCENVFDNIEKVSFNHGKEQEIIKQIQSYLMKNLHWNIELVSRQAVQEAHKLCRKKLG